jgi:hypothetical protein
MVSKHEVVLQHDRSSESCLYCEINDLVEEHLEGQEAVDIAEGRKSCRSCSSCSREEQQAQLLAATITYVGQAFLEKTGAIAGDSNMVQ